ncbi:MAG: rplE [Bacteriovoracaceae bacterium]|nr:rplE [Bacteriovoracaceae bacterium]
MSEEEKPKKKTSAAKATAKTAAPKAPKSRAESQERVAGVPARQLIKYKEEIVPKLVEEFKFKSSMQVPRLKKIVLNCGLGRATQNIKIIDQALKDVAAITGQKPVSTRSKVAISNFKLRAGLPIGVMVTLRGKRMYEFLDRLLSLAFPRIKDFRGISDRGFDARGNYTLGLKDQLVFPEVQYDTADSSFGMNISFVTTARSEKEGLALLTHFGFPFRKRQQIGQKAA